jgi:hypothetical protein
LIQVAILAYIYCLNTKIVGKNINYKFLFLFLPPTPTFGVPGSLNESKLCMALQKAKMHPRMLIVLVLEINLFVLILGL